MKAEDEQFEFWLRQQVKRNRISDDDEIVCCKPVTKHEIECCKGERCKVLGEVLSEYLRIKGGGK